MNTSNGPPSKRISNNTNRLQIQELLSTPRVQLKTRFQTIRLNSNFRSKVFSPADFEQFAQTRLPLCHQHCSVSMQIDIVAKHFNVCAHSIVYKSGDMHQNVLNSLCHRSRPHHQKRAAAAQPVSDILLRFSSLPNDLNIYSFASTSISSTQIDILLSSSSVTLCTNKWPALLCDV